MTTSFKRLAHEPSLYLRQHAHNPVDWYPWGAEALQRARELDRPIFLSIGYASCHWCHVMEREVFEDPEVARVLGAHFVAIKVDREERPDLDAVYMQAVQALTGRGGWPLSVFLTPARAPFFGGTYFPRDTFLELLDGIVRLYALQRDEVERSAGQLAGLVRQGVPAASTTEVDEPTLARAARALLVETDPVHGGVNGPQKFPTPVRWRFALRWLREHPDPPLARALRTTLDRMAAGGLRDHLGGGFFRYTVERTWTVPHFEKMLYDNAQLASLYALAGAALGAPGDLEVAADTLGFLLETLRVDGGGYGASLDADAGGHEGATYVWTPAQVHAVAGDDGAALGQLLGVTVAGNFEGASVLTRRLPDEPPGLFARHRAGLLAARARRPQPSFDRKVVTSWNGLALSALCHGHALLDDPRLLPAARGLADFLWQHHRRDDGGLCRASTDGRVAGVAILDDLAFVALGLLDLFEVGQELRDLQSVIELVERARRDFAHPEGGFYLTAADAEAPLGRSVEWMDGVEPSGQAALVQTLLRLAALTGREDLRDDAGRALAWHAELLRDHPLAAMAWLDAAALARQGPRQLAIAGAADAGDCRALRRAVGAGELHGVVVVHVPPEGPSPEQRALMPWLDGKRAVAGRATAYLCAQGRCLAPTSDPGELVAQLRAPA